MKRYISIFSVVCLISLLALSASAQVSYEGTTKGTQIMKKDGSILEYDGEKWVSSKKVKKNNKKHNKKSTKTETKSQSNE